MHTTDFAAKMLSSWSLSKREFLILPWTWPRQDHWGSMYKLKNKCSIYSQFGNAYLTFQQGSLSKSWWQWTDNFRIPHKNDFPKTFFNTVETLVGLNTVMKLAVAYQVIFYKEMGGRFLSHFTTTQNDRAPLWIPFTWFSHTHSGEPPIP